MEPQKTPNSQSNSEKKEQSWGYHTPWFQTILQSYSNQNSMLAEKQICRSMEQNWEPRNKPLICGQLIYDKGAKTIQWGKDSLLGKLDSHMQKNPYLIPYTKLTQDGLNIRPETIKLLNKNYRQYTLWHQS